MIRNVLGIMKGVVKGLILALLFVSCMKGDDEGPDSLDTSLLSAVAVYNGVAGTSNIDIFLDDNRLNSATERISLGEMLRHVSVLPGERALSSIFQLQAPEKDRESAVREVLVKPQQNKVKLEAGKFYSLFLYSKGDADLQYKLVEDKILKPAPGKFKIRVANFRMDVEGVAYTLVQGEQSSSQKVTLGEVSEFFDLPRADYKIAIEGLGRGYEKFVRDFSPDDQGVYTVWTWGSARTSVQTDADGKIRYPVTITKH